MKIHRCKKCHRPYKHGTECQFCLNKKSVNKPFHELRPFVARLKYEKMGMRKRLQVAKALISKGNTTRYVADRLNLTYDVVKKIKQERKKWLELK